MKRSPSIVFLPTLPPQATQILRNHNEDTLQVFTTYARTFAEQHVKTNDDALPLTEIHIGGTDKALVLPESLPATKLRSAFVALSGHGDEFESISDLCRTSRSGVFLEEAVIPHLDIYPDESKTPLNACMMSATQTNCTVLLILDPFANRSIRLFHARRHHGPRESQWCQKSRCVVCS